MSTVMQRSFTGGEIAPSLYSRVDMAKYATGLRTCKNFMVMRHGGVCARPGTQFIAAAKDSTKQVRLIPFVFNADQTYVLEFGEEYVRFFKDGAAVTVGTLTAWVTATAYVVGDLRSRGGVNYYCFAAHTSAAGTQPGVGADWATVWHALAGTILEVPTPYQEDELDEIHFVQSADVITMVHKTYPVHELKRLGATNWTLGLMSFTPAVSIPQGVSNNGSAVQTNFTVSGFTFDSPTKITASGIHGYSSGDVIFLSIKFMVLRYPPYSIAQYVSGSFKVVVTSTTEFTLQNIDGTNYTIPHEVAISAYTLVTSSFRRTSSGSWTTEYKVTAIDPVTKEESLPSVSSGTSSVPTSAAPLTITWTAVTGILRYNVYKKTSSSDFGFIGSTENLIFYDNAIPPDALMSPPGMNENIFTEVGNYPSTVGYYQQRLMFGKTDNKTETVWASRTGYFKNFTARNVTQDDDSIEFNLAGRQVNAVNNLLDLGRLLLMTSAGEWIIEGDSGGVFKPSAINPKQHSYFGSSQIQPCLIGNTALYVQARGTCIRDLGYDWQSEGYQGNDLTVFAAHLFDGYTVTAMAYQQIPDSIVWVVRSDGTLLGLTYVREHQVWGWHQHETDGEVESVCVVPEGNEDKLYLVVKREINGTDKRYIERMESRIFDELVDVKRMDCSLTYDGRHTAATTTMILSGGLWTPTDEITLTSSAAFFAAGDVGNEIHLTGSDGTVLRCRITAYTSNTVVTVMAHKTVPEAMKNIAITTWAKAVDVVTGLSHLEGKEVSVFGDGFVVASPNNPSAATITVTGGSITLDRCFSVIHVGLPYISDLETLDIDTVQGETLADKKKLVNSVAVRLENSICFWHGHTAPTGTNEVENLYESKPRNAESYELPPRLRTEVVDVVTRSQWDSNGRILIRNIDPIPLTVLAVAPKGLFPVRA